jgi:hypothetical protein
MKKVGVIQFAHASPQPNTVMIKTHHTVVAVMTMRSSLRPKDIAAFTIFHFADKSVS